MIKTQKSSRQYFLLLPPFSSGVSHPSKEEYLLKIIHLRSHWLCNELCWVLSFQNGKEVNAQELLILYYIRCTHADVGDKLDEDDNEKKKDSLGEQAGFYLLVEELRKCMRQSPS